MGRGRIVAALLVAFLALVPLSHAQELDNVLPQAGETDTGFLTRLLQDGLSTRGRDVTIAGFRGALSSQARFDQLNIADDAGVWLRITDATLQWNRAALFQRRIEIAEISAARVEVVRMPILAQDDTADRLAIPRFELPQLPVAISLGRLDVQDLVLDEAVLGQALRASVSGSARLEAGDGAANLRVVRLDDIEGLLKLEGGFSNDTRVLALDLDIREGPQGLAVSLLGIPDLPSAALTISGEGPISDFSADITLATDDQPRVEGTARLETAQPGVTHVVGLDLNGDLRPLLMPEFHPFFGRDSRLRTHARRFTDGSLSLDTLDIRTDKMTVSGRSRIGADRLPELIDLRAQIGAQDGARVLLPLAGARTSIDRADLNLGFDASIDEDWDLRLDVLGFDNGEITIDTLFANGLGRISTRGFGEEANVVDALVDFSTLGIGAADPALARALGRSVSGSLSFLWREGRPFLLPGFLLEGADYQLFGRARVENGVVDANVQAQLANAARLSGFAGRDLSGSLRTQIDAVWGPERDRLDLAVDLTGQDLTFEQAELDALFRGESRITMRANTARGVTYLHSFTAQAQTLRSDLRGSFSARNLDLSGDLAFSDLSVLGPAFGGSLASDIGVTGPIESARITVGARARDLAFGPEAANRLLRGETVLDLSATRDGTALDIAALRLRNPALRLNAAGRYAAGQSKITADVDIAQLAVIRPDIAGSVSAQLDLNEDAGTRILGFDASASNLRFGPVTELMRGTHQLTGQLLQDGPSVLLERLRITGPQITARVDGQQRGDSAEMTLDARLNSIAAIVPGITGAATLSGQATALANGGYALDLQAQGPAGANARVTGAISNRLQGDLRLSGSTDLALINPRLEPRSIQGPARFNLALQGPLALSSVTGRAEADGVSFVLPQQNLRLTNLTASADLAGPRASVAVQGRAATGGEIALNGVIDLLDQMRSDLRASATNLRISNPQLFESTVTGQVSISGQLLAEHSITGAVTLDRTEIRIPRAGLVGRGYIPPAIRHTGESAPARATRDRAGIFEGATHGRVRRSAALNISVDAPSRIFIRGRGLDAELGGSLRLTGTTLDVIPIGEFGLIRGRLDLLGNRFTLTEGFASLQGDFIPFVRLAAATERAGVTARVVLQGRVDDPEILFESSPELPQDEIVSLLLFGRGLETLSLFQAAQLASSLATLTGRSDGIMERLRRNIGLDDLDVRTDEDGETTIRLGRYLTETIYTDVEVSPQGNSEVSVNIDLSPSLTARGRLDNKGRASVGLFFERDY